MPRKTSSNTGKAQIKKQGHTKDAKGHYGTDPMAKRRWGGGAVDLKR